MSEPIDRRNWIRTTAAAAGAATCLTASSKPSLCAMQDAKAAPNARLTANKSTVDWPYWDDAEAQGLLDALNSGKWGRPGGGKWVAQFESAFGAAMQARYCLATASGTTALLTSLGALNIGPGDEVLLPPYTFVATFNAITHSFALPVFVDSDPETFQIDASKIAAKINDQTKTIIPVHIGGSVADMDAVLSAAQARKIPVIEDACQAPLAQWRNRPVGTWGLGGCLSFQTSKNISSGEGGAVLTNDEEFFNRCFNFHTPGGGKSVESLGRGSNYRLTEFQAATLLVQLSRAESHAKTRDENATYLNQMFAEIPGIQPAKLTAGCTRSAWHLYMWRYDPKQFANLSRAGFLKELAKEGIPASSGYTPLNSSAHVRALANNPHYLRIYGKATMEQWAQRNACPVNDRLCEEAVWFTQDKLLGTKADMERYAKAISNIQMRAPSLTKT